MIAVFNKLTYLRKVHQIYIFVSNTAHTHSCEMSAEELAVQRQWIRPVVFNTFMCFSKERDYLVLLRTYSCTTTDSIRVLKCKVLEHYSDICAVLEVTDWLTVLCVRVCVRASVFVCCLFVILCSSADTANKRAHFVHFDEDADVVVVVLDCS